MTTIGMEMRGADVERREIVGVAAPYDETTALVADPGGEVIAPGAFAKSIAERGSRIPLFLNHDHKAIHGFASHWEDGPLELLGVFKVRADAAGDQLLIDARDGYLPGMSVDFQPVQVKRRADGVRIVREAKLHGVSLVTIPAYQGARVLATRAATEIELIDVSAMFGPRPDIDLSPLPRFWG